MTRLPESRTPAFMCLLATLAGPCAGADPGLVAPSSVFAQLGGNGHAAAATGGLTWDWALSQETRWGRLAGYWEAAFGRWHAERANGADAAWVLQLGVTPVLRLEPQSGEGRWFVEGGIGLNYLTPLYQEGDKRFTTRLNFGSHLAVGRRFGEVPEHHEVALRVQHFSNAGIRHPNPGSNFLQLRYSRRF